MNLAWVHCFICQI